MYYVQLRAFHAVATYGGFSKAADRLCLTQPAVSDQVKKLEDHFGGKLFLRKRRAVELTENGEQLYDVTKRMFTIEAEAIEMLQLNQKLEQGFLNIAADAPFHVVEMISKFQSHYPDIKIALLRGNSDTILQQLKDFRADIGVVSNIPTDSGLVAIPLRSDKFVVFMRKTDSLADKKSIGVHELANMPMIFREQGSNTRRLVESMFSQKGSIPTVAMVAEGREAYREAVASGLGYGLTTLPEFGHDSRLCCIPVTDSEVEMTEYVVFLKEQQHARIITAFLKTANLCA